MTSLSTPLFKRFNSDNNNNNNSSSHSAGQANHSSAAPSSSSGSSLSIKITKHNYTFDGPMSANNNINNNNGSSSSSASMASPLKWRLGSRKSPSSCRNSKDSRDSASISSSENIPSSANKHSGSGNANINSTVFLASPQSSSSKINLNSPVQSRTKIRNISSGSSSSQKNLAASPISNYEASRLYFKKNSRNSSTSMAGTTHSSSPLSTPKSATYNQGVLHDSGSSYSTINGNPDIMNASVYKPIPSPFDSSSFTKSPILQMIKSPIMNKKSSTSSFTSIIPKKIRSNLTNNGNEPSNLLGGKSKKLKGRLSDLDLGKNKYKRTPASMGHSYQQHSDQNPPPVPPPIPPPKSKPSISNFSHYSNSNSSGSHTQLHSMALNKSNTSNFYSSSASSIPTNIRSKSQGPAPFSSSTLSIQSSGSSGGLAPSRSGQNLKNKNCVICDEKLEIILQTSPNKKEKIIEMRCSCFCHEDCLKSSIYFEKEKAVADSSSKNPSHSKLTSVDKAFPICFNCGGSVRAIPKNQELIDELVTEYLTYEPKPVLLKSISPSFASATSPFPSVSSQSPYSMPSSTSSGSSAKAPSKHLTLNTNFLTSPLHNPYQNVNSPSNTFSKHKTLSPLAKSPINNPVLANNPYIQNTLKGGIKSPTITSESSSSNRVTTQKNVPLSQIDLRFERQSHSANPSSAKANPKLITSKGSQTTPLVRKKNTTSLIRDMKSIPSKKHPQFQVQRQAPFPPINAESRQRLTSKASVGSNLSRSSTSSTAVLESPSKKPPLPYDTLNRAGSVSPQKHNSSIFRNKNNLSIDIPTKLSKPDDSSKNDILSKAINVSSSSLEKKRSMHDLSFGILNQSTESKSQSSTSVFPVLSAVSTSLSKNAGTVNAKLDSSVNSLGVAAPTERSANIKCANSKSRTIIHDDSRSRKLSVSAVSSVVSSASRSLSPSGYDCNNSEVSRSNSITSSISVATDNNTYSQNAVGGRASITTVREKFSDYLKDNLKDQKDQLILNDQVLNTFGELRLVDNLLISINSMETSKFLEKTVYLFKERLLVINPNYNGFISLKLNLQSKVPKVEISSTSIVKLDFRCGAANPGRNINSVYLSIDETNNDVIQKWAAALFDYECDFPPLIFTSTLKSTLNEIMGSEFLPQSVESNDDEYDENTDEDFDDDEKLDASRSKFTKNGKNQKSNIFQHNSESQSTISVGNRQSLLSTKSPSHPAKRANRVSVLPSNGYSRKAVGNGSRYGLPKTLLLFINHDKAISESDSSVLRNIIKVLLIRISNIQIIGSTNSFQNQSLNIGAKTESAKLDCIGKKPSVDKQVALDINSYIDTYLKLQKDYSSSKDIGLLLVSTSSIVTPPLISHTCPVAIIQVGIPNRYNKNLVLSNNVISVPVWENLMEAICKSFSISFDNDDDDDDDDDDDSMSDGNDKADSDSEYASDYDDGYELETAKLDLDEISDKKRENEELLAKRLEALRLRSRFNGQISSVSNLNLAKNQVLSLSSANRASSGSSIQESESSSSDEGEDDNNYDSDDSTKAQLMRLKEQGVLKNDNLLDKFSNVTHSKAVDLENASSRLDKHADNDDSEEYYESEASDSDSTSEFNSDDSTREQLKRINRTEILKDIGQKASHEHFTDSAESEDEDQSVDKLTKEHINLSNKLLGPTDLESEAQMMKKHDSSSSSNATSVQSSFKNFFGYSQSGNNANGSQNNFKISFNSVSKGNSKIQDGGFSRFGSREPANSGKLSSAIFTISDNNDTENGIFKGRQNGLSLVKNLARKIESQDSTDIANSTNTSTLSLNYRSRPLTMPSDRSMLTNQPKPINQKVEMPLNSDTKNNVASKHNGKDSDNSAVTTPKGQIYSTNNETVTPVLTSRSPTPRWSMLFQGIDKEWESLKEDDEGYMRYSKWKTFSLNEPKKS